MEQTLPAVEGPLERQVRPLVERLRMHADNKTKQAMQHDGLRAADEIERCFTLIAAAERALAQLRNPEWGKWRYMEGSDVYDDLRNAADPLDAALAALRPNVSYPSDLPDNSERS